MSPQDLLRFLNQYLDRMNDSIHLNHGFIDKFIGDAIMALFDRSLGSQSVAAGDAILAVIEMQKTRIEYNQCSISTDTAFGQKERMKGASRLKNIIKI